MIVSASSRTGLQLKDRASLQMYFLPKIRCVKDQVDQAGGFDSRRSSTFLGGGFSLVLYKHGADSLEERGVENKSHACTQQVRCQRLRGRIRPVHGSDSGELGDLGCRVLERFRLPRSKTAGVETSAGVQTHLFALHRTCN